MPPLECRATSARYHHGFSRLRRDETGVPCHRCSPSQHGRGRHHSATSSPPSTGSRSRPGRRRSRAAQLPTGGMRTFLTRMASSRNGCAERKTSTTTRPSMSCTSTTSSAGFTRRPLRGRRRRPRLSRLRRRRLHLRRRGPVPVRPHEPGDDAACLCPRLRYRRPSRRGRPGCVPQGGVSVRFVKVAEIAVRFPGCRRLPCGGSVGVHLSRRRCRRAAMRCWRGVHRRYRCRWAAG